MAKKRQPDFSKAQLKPGRYLGKRANATSTKFKAKKIVMPKEKVIKAKSEITIMDFIRKIKSPGNEKERANILGDLSKFILRHSDSVPAHLHSIFDTVISITSDPHDFVRHNAIRVIVSVLDITDDMDLHIFSDVLCTHIDTLMKNPNPKISPAALIILDCMLKNHPNLICHNIGILYDLLPNERKHYTRKIMSVKESYQYSERGEINALGHINTFIKNIILQKNKDDVTVKEENEDNVVYMDENKPLSVVLYAGSGLKPVDIEKSFSKLYSPKSDPFVQAEKLTSFLQGVLILIPTYYSQIMGSESNVDDNVLKYDAISDLSIIFQLLCNVAELAEMVDYDRAVGVITAFLKREIFSTQHKRFPFELHSIMSGVSVQPLALLNTSICFLYMKFLYSNERASEDDVQLIEMYLKKFFSAEKSASYSSDIKCQCIPFFVKMINLYNNRTDVPKVIYILLKRLVLLMKTRINHPNKKMLLNLLYSMTFLPEYKFWHNKEAMDLWYEWLFSHFHTKEITKIDNKILKILSRVGKLKHSSFMKHLNFNVLKPFLKHNRSDFREFGILMLHNIDIDRELLKNVYDITRPDSFPVKSTIALVHVLSVRFNQYPVNKRPYVAYIEFLLNIALDVSSVSNDELLDFEANKYAKAIEAVQHGQYFCVMPSLLWKEHSKLFKVCKSYLGNLPVAPVTAMYMKLVDELLHSSDIIPVHCALAMLKLDNPEMDDSFHRMLMSNLNLSCLITMSVLTQISMNDAWYKWNVCELMESVSLTANTVMNILNLLERGEFFKVKPAGLVVYHILRTLKVFIERGLLNLERRNVIELGLQILTSLAEEQCSDKTLKQQPLYRQLYTFFVERYVG